VRVRRVVGLLGRASRMPGMPSKNSAPHMKCLIRPAGQQVGE
jgi:hypothetical protein